MATNLVAPEDRHILPTVVTRARARAATYSEASEKGSNPVAVRARGAAPFHYAKSCCIPYRMEHAGAPRPVLNKVELCSRDFRPQN